jgi:hypothetical protein
MKDEAELFNPHPHTQQWQGADKQGAASNYLH